MTLCALYYFGESAYGVNSDLQVLSLKSIQFTITDNDFAAIACLEELEEVVLDCDQPPEGQGQSEEAKWGLLHFPEAMKQLTNMTHLTLSCHYGITALPQGISRLNKLEVCSPAILLSCTHPGNSLECKPCSILLIH